MIYDLIKNIGNYRGQSIWLDKAISFLETTDLSSLPVGRIEIEKDKVFVNVMEAEAKKEEDLKFEIHKKYMDIQIDIEGSENIKVGFFVKEVIDEYKDDIDFGTVDCGEATTCTLGKERFIICMGEEPHKPGVATSDKTYLRKCVIKVAVN